MKVNLFVCALVGAVLLPAAALADDPNDPSMRNAAARARDREMTRQLNLRQGAMVRERDARYAAQNQGYTQSRADYEQQMAAWRRAVAACNAGDYAACGN
jgi:hypothetical protein